MVDNICTGLYLGVTSKGEGAKSLYYRFTINGKQKKLNRSGFPGGCLVCLTS